MIYEEAIMEKQISFIHAADLHLDSPFKGMANIPKSLFQEIRNSTFTALDQLILAAIKKKVDFILLVGDLFDNEKQSLKAQIRLRRAFEKLNEHGIIVYLSYGNHDHINGNDFPVTYPNNVFIFPSEKVNRFIFKKDNENLAAIYGFSYENRAVIENKASEYKIIDNLPFNIATLHGSIKNNNEHDTYAPFQIKDLLQEDYDYWALGHIHKHQVLRKNPPIIYPGNIQGRNRTETGVKGCYHVKLSESKVQKKFIPLNALQFNQLIIDVSNCREIHEIELEVQKAFKNNQIAIPQLIDLKLTSENEILTKWNEDKHIEDIIELINETFVHEKNWNYIFNYTIEVQQTKLEEHLYKGDHFLGELIRQFENVPIHLFLEDLYKHQQGRKYLAAIEDNEEALIKDRAKQLLVNKLLNS